MQKKTLISSALLTGLLLVTASKSAYATDWSSIIKKSDYEIFVDIDSYNIEDGYPSIVSKTVFKKMQNKPLNSKKIQFSVIEIHQQFNCKSPLYRTKLTQYFDKKRKLKGTENGTMEFQPILASSNEFSIGQLTCQVNQMLGGQ